MQSRLPTSPCLKKFKSHASTGKAMLTVFFDTDRALLPDFKSYYDTINANRYCQAIQSCAPRSRTITVNSLTVSHCYMTMPVPKWPTELRTDQKQSNWRCSNVLYIGQTYCHTIFTPLRLLTKSHPRWYIHVGQCAGHGGLVV